MRIFNKIRNLTKSPKKTLATLGTLSVLLAAPLAVHAGFFPGRPTFDYNNYNGNNNCADPSNPARNNGRCGSLNGPVFDSFVNVPNVGDERGFLDGYRSDQTQAGSHADPLTNVTDGSQEVVLRLYIHNNANSGTNCTADHQNADGTCSQVDANALGVARNTQVKIALPSATTTGNDLRAVGYISADNATPGTVEDTFDMTSNKNFTVEYEPGSAELFNNGPFKNGVALPDSVVAGGTQVGYSALNGIFPGCFDYIATVQIKVRIKPVSPPPTPNIGLTKQVRMTGTKTWGSEVATKPGDDVQWLLNTTDTSQANLTNVITRDLLPAHLQLDPGSVQITDAKGTKALADTPLFAGGYNTGSYAPNDNTLITFKTKVLGDFDGCNIRVRNVGYAKSDQTPNEVSDDADVVITKENCNQQQTPTFSCDSLTVTPGDNRTATFTTAASAAGGAQITLYKYDFGDGTPVLLTDQSSVNHTYAKDGQYASRVTVQVTVNNKPQDVTSDKCAAAVTFTTPPVTPPSTPGTPGQPTSLVNTGPGSVAALFTLATIFGAAVYHRVLSRRLSRQ